MTKTPLFYPSARALHDAPSRRITLIAMSGLGKTYLSSILRETGDWFHYSVDYRIGTRYLGEHIVDNFKREAMATPFLREMLMSDSIYIGSNITFDNLAPLSAYLGKPGDPTRGGISFDEYMRRQILHREGEIAATCDTVDFIGKAEDIYGYRHFVADTSGSICEVVDPDDPKDPVLTALSQNSLIVWLKGTEDHIETLCKRFDRAPKPMYTREDAMRRRWAAHLSETGLDEANVDPDAFIRWSFREIIEDRLPLYARIAQNWGVTLPVEAVSGVTDEAGFIDAVASVLD